ncbi:uncharacterized protein LOC123693165 [Colias croceus]|uniref:uncharacterized protein LOC123693165 n=1 Tax=Colias crocea TaxID=72248 RepID=UPI001E27FA0B|nr:uncharacterized protein LOC123693165 [Colias croceus]
MAPRETVKATPKLQRTITKATKAKASPVSVKKVMSRNTKERIPIKVNNTNIESRPRTNTVPKVSTPKPKENNSDPFPASVTKSAKKANWKRRPKPAHSGVPVPEKMKKLLEKQLQDADCSL